MFDAEMMPTGHIPDVAAMKSHFFQGRNKWIPSSHYRKNMKISLAFEVADKKAEEEAEIKKQQEQQRNGGEHGNKGKKFGVAPSQKR
ncbi:MAG: hypothetical protein GWN93_27275 [Deltaproteobacteria bacterium]|nr:hypothetical protein [Deltaproteobacteria bacterium]